MSLGFLLRIPFFNDEFLRKDRDYISKDFLPGDFIEYFFSKESNTKEYKNLNVKK